MVDKNIISVENKKTTIDDDIDRGREMDDDDVRDWEKNLIKGSHIPGKVLLLIFKVPGVISGVFNFSRIYAA